MHCFVLGSFAEKPTVVIVQALVHAFAVALMGLRHVCYGPLIGCVAWLVDDHRTDRSEYVQTGSLGEKTLESAY